MTDFLKPDRDQIERWFATLFRHAGAEGYVSMRAYTHNSKPLFKKLWTVPLSGGLPHVFEQAYGVAHRVANNPEPGVFCPPPAVFNGTGENYGRAREEDLLLGLVISVECDEHPEEARQRLQEILGETTMIVKSGGQWINGNSEPEDKLHLYWRLAIRAKGEELKKLKRARDLATRIAGGDSSNKPIVHCLRSAGSWHRKAAPRLCFIAQENPDREIDLDDALRLLEAAAPPSGNGQTKDFIKGDHTWRDLVGGILQGKNLHNSLDVLAAKMVTAEANPRGANINIVRTLMEFSPAKFERPTEWQARYNDIPRDFTTAEAKFKNPSPTDCLPIEWSEGLSYELEAGDFVEGVLVDGCLAVVYGDSSVGKSFWVINLGLHIAGGRRWYERAIDQGVVIYVALEGGKLTKNRVRAAREAVDLPADIPFALATCSLDMRTSNADAIKLTNTIRAAMQKYTEQNLPVRLIVIDTMSRALNGGAEDAEDMGLLLKHADLVRHETGTAVLFVAHCGKDATKGIRGWSGIRAAIDVEIEIAKNDADPPYIATITKERDLMSGARFGYTLKPVELGRNRRDRMVTTCIIEPADEVKKPVSKTKLTDAHADFRDYVMEIIADHGQAVIPIAGMPTVKGVTRELMRNELIRRGWFHEGQLSAGKLQKGAYGVENNALRALKRRELISFSPGYVWLTKPAFQPRV